MIVKEIDETTVFQVKSNQEAAWLEQNAAKYGFIIRYPKGKDTITGYKYEP
jgi:LAS superfamily LD-carboxypeptidase LdcB